MSHYCEISEVVERIMENERVKLTLQSYMNNMNRQEIIAVIEAFVQSFKYTENRIPTANDFIEECYACSYLFD